MPPSTVPLHFRELPLLVVMLEIRVGRRRLFLLRAGLAKTMIYSSLLRAGLSFQCHPLCAEDMESLNDCDDAEWKGQIRMAATQVREGSALASWTPVSASVTFLNAVTKHLTKFT